MNQETLLLSRQDVARCIDIQEVVSIVQTVLRAQGEGQVIMPAKNTLNLHSAGVPFSSHAMPAYVAPYGVVGLKWAGGLPNNPARHNLPFIMSTMLLQDPDTGLMLAIMDGVHLTALRTGAMAAVCASLTWRPGADTVALVGAGVQGRQSVAALRHLMSMRDLRVADIRPEAAEDLAAEMRRQGVAARACATVREAVEGADVVIATTSATTPVISDEWLKPGVAAVAIGSGQEFDDRFGLTADRLLVDNLEQCIHRGELALLFEKGLLTEDRVYAEVAEVAAGRKPGRQGDDERILTVAIGLGSLDAGVAAAIHQKAREMGIGARFSFM